MKKILETIKGIEKISQLLPALMSIVTQGDRYLPEIEWSHKSWTHNVFRFYEMLFWRRHGIRVEWSSDDNGKITHFSFESRLAYIETKIRLFLSKIPRLKFVKIYLPVFAFSNIIQRSFRPYLFAIALDNNMANSVAIAAGPLSGSYTCTGSNRMLVAGVYYNPNTTEDPTCTYNSVSLSQTQKVTGNTQGYLFMLFAPATGSNTFVLTPGSAGRPESFGLVSYTGVNQSNTPDSTNGTSQVATSPASIATTVVAANCWTVLVVQQETSIAASTGCTLRVDGAGGTPGNRLCLFDSNGTVSTGSHTMTVTNSAGTNCNMMIVSLAPVASTVINSGFLMFM